MNINKARRDDELLKPLRGDLDDCDKIILDAIARRYEIIRNIAEIKKNYQIPMMQKHRIESVLHKVESHAVNHKLEPRFLHEIYKLLIEEACRIEDEIINLL